mmetsp:Transcript_13628/g.29211  ORF Transcript_13628/g.29211 Transcript_13628/m.29211 type:complete len:397 (-) Transcript_13628:2290-3480(-)
MRAHECLCPSFHAFRWHSLLQYLAPHLAAQALVLSCNSDGPCRLVHQGLSQPQRFSCMGTPHSSSACSSSARRGRDILSGMLHSPSRSPSSCCSSCSSSVHSDSRAAVRSDAACWALRRASNILVRSSPRVMLPLGVGVPASAAVAAAASLCSRASSWISSCRDPPAAATLSCSSCLVKHAPLCKRCSRCRPAFSKRLVATKCELQCVQHCSRSRVSKFLPRPPLGPSRGSSPSASTPCPAPAATGPAGSVPPPDSATGFHRSLCCFSSCTSDLTRVIRTSFSGSHKPPRNSLWADVCAGTSPLELSGSADSALLSTQGAATWDMEARTEGRSAARAALAQASPRPSSFALKGSLVRVVKAHVANRIIWCHSTHTRSVPGTSGGRYSASKRCSPPA